MLLTGLEREREKVDQKYAWNLADICPDVAAWRADKTRITADVALVRALDRKSTRLNSSHSRASRMPSSA